MPEFTSSLSRVHWLTAFDSSASCTTSGNMFVPSPKSNPQRYSQPVCFQQTITTLERAFFDLFVFLYQINHTYHICVYISSPMLHVWNVDPHVPQKLSQMQLQQILNIASIAIGLNTCRYWFSSATCFYFLECPTERSASKHHSAGTCSSEFARERLALPLQRKGLQAAPA